MSSRSKTSSREMLSRHLKRHGVPAFQMGGERRGRILEESRRARLNEASGQGLGFHRLPGVSLTAAAVAFVILSAGFMAGMPGHVPSSSQMFAPEGAAPSGIWADYSEGNVIVSWNGQENREFAVRQGSRVTLARTAEPVRVKGTRFVQNAVPKANEAVFYVVE